MYHLGVFYKLLSTASTSCRKRDSLRKVARCVSATRVATRPLEGIADNRRGGCCASLQWSIMAERAICTCSKCIKEVAFDPVSQAPVNGRSIHPKTKTDHEKAERIARSSSKGLGRASSVPLAGSPVPQRISLAVDDGESSLLCLRVLLNTSRPTDEPPMPSRKSRAASVPLRSSARGANRSGSVARELIAPVDPRILDGTARPVVVRDDEPVQADLAGIRASQPLFAAGSLLMNL
jgi:hypothetical protein